MAHILLAEDYPANILIATALLEEFGYSYSVANNGEQAVTLAMSTHFDLILMDVQMPDMDGFEATQRIREHQLSLPSHRHTPIIGMTAHALAGDRERCISSGMDDYMAKPFHPDELKGKLEKHLSPRTL